MYISTMNANIVRQLLLTVTRRGYSYKSVRRPEVSSSTAAKKPKNALQPSQSAPTQDLSRHLRGKILATGPLTVAEYMREILTNPLNGYYMHRDVFGREGDFTTSPEISQIFGEVRPKNHTTPFMMYSKMEIIPLVPPQLVAVWVLSEWRKLGSPSPFQLVELGPGRGTLARDVLKVLAKFKLGAEFSLHMVEISPQLSKQQAQRICYEHTAVDDSAQLSYYQSGRTASGSNVYWYRRLEDVPTGFSIVLAHEFFDALPVHKLQLDGDGIWKEVLIDVATIDEGCSDVNFRYVLSKAQTPVSRIYEPIHGEQRTTLEHSMETDRLVGMLSERLERDGGFALIMDYGHFGEKGDTFRAFKRHQLHDPLEQPGSADLTADVDFRRMKHTAERDGRVCCFGPVQQRDFLKRMEGDARLELLLEQALPEHHELVRSGYEMLTDPQQMGARFKFLALFPSVLRAHLARFPVSGFQ